MPSSPQINFSFQTQVSVYGAGMFANSMAITSGVIIPLWVTTFSSSATLIRLIFGVRHFLPLLLSIHGGALIDRLGTRRVIIVFAVLNTVISLFFPFFPIFGQPFYSKH